MRRERKELEEEIMSALRSEKDDVFALRQQIQGLHRSLEKKSKQFFSPVMVGIIAGFLVLVGITGLYIHFSELNPTSEVIYERYYRQFEMPLTTRGSDTPTGIERALLQYAQKDYSSALATIASFHSTSPEVTFFISGLCYQQMGLIDMAIKNYDRAEAASIYYKEHIQWYKALCFIKKNDQQVAAVILKKLGRNSNTYGERAYELLRLMED